MRSSVASFVAGWKRNLTPFPLAECLWKVKPRRRTKNARPGPNGAKRMGGAQGYGRNLTTPRLLVLAEERRKVQKRCLSVVELDHSGRRMGRWEAQTDPRVAVEVKAGRGGGRAALLRMRGQVIICERHKFLFLTSFGPQGPLCCITRHSILWPAVWG